MMLWLFKNSSSLGYSLVTCSRIKTFYPTLDVLKIKCYKITRLGLNNGSARWYFIWIRLLRCLLSMANTDRHGRSVDLSTKILIFPKNGIMPGINGRSKSKEKMLFDFSSSIVSSCTFCNCLRTFCNRNYPGRLNK